MLLLAIGFIGSMGIFVAVILLAARPSVDQKRMVERFKAVRKGGSNGLVAEDAGLLIQAEPDLSNKLGNLLIRLAKTSGVGALIVQADSRITLPKLLLACVGSAILGGVALLIFVPLLYVAVPGGLVAGYVPVLLLTLRRRQRLAAFNKALPDAIDMMSRSLRAGHSMVAAINIVAEHAAAPASTEFREVFRQQNFGLPLRDAMMQLLERIPSSDLRVLVTGILVQKDTGGNLAEILDRIVAVIRDRLKIQGEIRTHTAQGRMTGWILCLLPVVMLLAINMINPGYSKTLTSDPLGRKLLYVGFGLLAFGAFLIRKIVNGIEV